MSTGLRTKERDGLTHGGRGARAGEAHGRPGVATLLVAASAYARSA